MLNIRKRSSHLAFINESIRFRRLLPLNIYKSINPTGRFLSALLLGAFLIIIGSLPLRAAEGPDIVTELSSEWKYTHLEEEFPYLESELRSAATLGIEASGLFSPARQNWQYVLKVKSWAADTRAQGFTSDCVLEELVLSALIKKDTPRAQFSLLEIGKKDWEWGKCFSRIPTYPLPAGNFWGAQWTIPSDDRHLILGMATLKEGFYEVADESIRPSPSLSLNSHNPRPQATDNIFTAWIRTGGFLTVSDYEIVFSSQNNNPAREVSYNLGADFSRDFLNGLATHGSVNLKYFPEEAGKPSSARDTYVDYVFGGEYINGDRTMVCEVFGQSKNESAGLVWAINNHSALFATWRWELESVWDLKDHGRFYGFFLKYTAQDRLTPSLELLVYDGPEDSQIGSSPFDMILIMEIKAVL